MTYEKISKIASWLSNISAGMAIFALLMSMIVPEPLQWGFGKLSLEFAFGSLMNLGFSKWCSLAAKHQAREDRRQQWLKDTRR